MAERVPDYFIQHRVSEMMSLMGASSSDGHGPEVYADLLEKNKTPFVSTQITSHSALRKIASNTSKPEEFLQKHEELKLKNIKGVDSVTYLLSRLWDDPATRGELARHAEDRAAASRMHASSESRKRAGSRERMKARLLSEDKSGSSSTSHVSTVVSTVVTAEVLRQAEEKKAAKNMNLPEQPDWVFTRPYLSRDFVLDAEPQEPDLAPVGTLPVHAQEKAVMEDLLYCMEGIEGQYIHPLPLTDSYAQRDFSIDHTLDGAMTELVKRILPLCSNYSIIARFIEEKSAFEYGMVNQALGAALRTIIKDYMVLVAQLENQLNTGMLSLQKFWFYVQPSMHTLDICASIANAINKRQCTGGAVLGLLHDKTCSLVGDHQGQELCLFLTQSACVPYFEMLERWIYKGIISDPYHEFLVIENQETSRENLSDDYNDKYWEKHYILSRERTPVFLERVADKILNTGKYVNVFRQCGREVRCPHAAELVYTFKERQYYEQIERAYTYASQLLLKFLMDEKELMARLRSVKQYFLLQHGDFLVQFMDMADEELAKLMEDILLPRLDTLLEVALRTSTAKIDPFKDDLKVDLLPFDLITMMFSVLRLQGKFREDFDADDRDSNLTGLEAFTFDYIVKWPISLVLNRKAMTHYQILFRHLFYCKHVERQLCNVWLGNKSAKMFPLQSTRWFAPAFALRQRMLNFVQNFLYYMLVEVIEPHWLNFQNKLDTVSNIDDVLEHHQTLLNNCIVDCMLNRPHLLQIVHKIMVVCITFSNFIQRLNNATNVKSQTESLTQSSTLQAAPTASDRKDDQYRKETATKVVKEDLDQLASSSHMEQVIAKFSQNFTGLLVELLDKIVDVAPKEEHKFMNMIYRLNFDNFYTAQLESLSAERSFHASTSSSSSSSASLASSASLGGSSKHKRLN